MLFQRFLPADCFQRKRTCSFASLRRENQRIRLEMIARMTRAIVHWRQFSFSFSFVFFFLSFFGILWSFPRLRCRDRQYNSSLCSRTSRWLGYPRSVIQRVGQSFVSELAEQRISSHQTCTSLASSAVRSSEKPSDPKFPASSSSSWSDEKKKTEENRERERERERLTRRPAWLTSVKPDAARSTRSPHAGAFRLPLVYFVSIELDVGIDTFTAWIHGNAARLRAGGSAAARGRLRSIARDA